MKIKVCLVHHSGKNLLERTLDSLEGTTAEVAVVDTSLNHEALPICESRGVRHIQGGENGGYAWALARGFDAFGSKLDVFVASNSDVVFLPGSLEELARACAGGDCVAYPMQLESTEGPVACYNALDQFSRAESVARWTGFGRSSLARSKSRFIGEAINAEGAIVPFPPFLGGSGACFAMRGDVWDATGGLDTRFFLYEEDREFSLRLSENGFSAVLCTGSKVIHEGGISRGGLSLFTLQEALLSERILWRMRGFRPANGALILQHIGVLLRFARCALSRDSVGRATYGRLVCRLFTYYRHDRTPMRAGGARKPLEGNR